MTVPKPLATSATQVTHDPVSQSLLVRPAAGAGYVGLLWWRGHRAMVERVGQLGEPAVWSHGVGRGVAERDGWLRFPPDAATYRKLTSSPDLSAILVVDRESSQILFVRFRSRP